MTWRPIDTAPRDTEAKGYSILVIDAATPSDPQYSVVYEAWSDKDGAVWFDGNVRRRPTHWMPLPPPPSALEHGGLEVPDA